MNIIHMLTFAAIFAFLITLESQGLKATPRRTCLVTHILSCNAQGCDIMCADGTKCRKEGLPVSVKEVVECK